MTRVERNSMLKEAEVVMGEFINYAADQMLDYSSSSDEEDLMMIKMLRLSNKLMDYARFQSEQFDHIEDKLDEMYDLVKRLNKEAM